MKKLLTLFALTLLTKLAMAQCTPAPSMTLANSPTTTQPLQVSFTATTPSVPSTQSVSAIVRWGDGSNSFIGMTANATHNYAATGTYPVKYVYYKYDSLTQSLICADSITQSINVSYPPCLTNFTTTATGPLQLTFNTVNYAGTAGLTYTWNFGDGTSGTGATVTHTYTSSLSRTVTLTVTGSNCSYTTSKTVYPNNCLGLSAAFSSSVNGPVATFTNNSTVAGTQTHLWKFGDGSTSTVNNPVHAYPNAGTYMVTLINYWGNCFDSVTHPVVITGPNGPNKIWGQIAKDSSVAPSNPTYKVWLITFDSSSNILSAIDSVVVSATGAQHVATYQFNNVASGQYRVKAAMQNNVTTINGFVPTYHLSALLWSNANIIQHTSGSTYAGINMQKGTVTSGPGFVGGNVSMGANKGTASGVEGLMVYLTDVSDQMIKAAKTDVNGDYSFGQVPAGTYRIFPEMLGFMTTPSSYFTMNSNNIKQEGMNFKVSENAKTITPAPASISNTTDAVSFSIYPNPAKDVAILQWSANTSAAAHIIVTDVTGKKVLETTAQTATNTELNLSNFNQGLYFITVQTENGQTTSKLTVK